MVGQAKVPARAFHSKCDCNCVPDRETSDPDTNLTKALLSLHGDLVAVASSRKVRIQMAGACALRVRSRDGGWGFVYHGTFGGSLAAGARWLPPRLAWQALLSDCGVRLIERRA